MTIIELFKNERWNRLLEASKNIYEILKEPCWYDHHGNCQAHYLGNPCEVEIFKQAIEAVENIEKDLKELGIKVR